MQFSRLLFLVAALLAPVALFGTAWLYFYPVFDAACAFPQPPNSTAPFRLLALGDPQLEGDSSLPKPGALVFPSLHNISHNVREAESWSQRLTLVNEGGRKAPKDFIKWVWGKRKWIDLWGNDWYLAHIVRTLRWWTAPSHVAVLGDLLGSQWVKDDEFERRTRRFWDVVFRGMEKVPETIMTGEEEDVQAEGAREGEEGAQEHKKKWGGTLEILGADKRWENRVINIAGNHDIGYAGDIDVARIERFERAFGKVNWDMTFTLPPSNVSAANEENTQAYPPALRLVVLNSMNLDTPAWTPSLQTESYAFMNNIITSARSVHDKTHATVLLTHIPFNKEAGVCVDSPLFTFFEGGSGVKEQNMLSDYVSKITLEGIFGLSGNRDADGQGFGRPGIVINGHDHAGCDVLHYIRQPGHANECPSSPEIEELRGPEFKSNVSDTASEPDSPSDPEPPKWQALRYPHAPHKVLEDGSCVVLDQVPRVREITLRSMMGDFAGYAGFLSAWFDPAVGKRGEWKLEFSTCGMGVQHWWWTVHIVDLILVGLVLVGGVASAIESWTGVEPSEKSKKAVEANRRVQEKKEVANGRPAKGVENDDEKHGRKERRR